MTLSALKIEDDSGCSRGFFQFERDVGKPARGELQFTRVVRMPFRKPSDGGGGAQKCVQFDVRHDGPNYGAVMPRTSAPLEELTCDGELLIAELRKRLHPNTGLHAKTLAAAIGVHGETLERWMRGEAKPSWSVAGELMRFFWKQGDKAFLFAVLRIDPASIMPSADQVAAALREKGMAA